MTLEELLAEVKELVKEGGDLYQKYADKHHITRAEAKLFLFHIVYSRKINEEK